MAEHEPTKDLVARFARVYIEIGNVCNLQCRFCPEVERTNKLMSRAEFAHVLEQVKPYTKEVCLHVMGEPLAHPKFLEFVELCGEQGLQVQITTNATLLKPQNVEALLKTQVRQINFSIQSFSANRETVTPEELNRYLAPIFAFVKRAEQERPELYLQFRLWDDGSTETHEKAVNDQLRVALQKQFAVEIDRAKVDIRFRKTRPLGGRKSVHFDSRFRWPSIADQALGQEGTCHALSQHIAIHADGKVVPCCLDKEAAIELGNIFKQSFAQILESERVRKMAEGFAEGRFREALCQRCDFAQRFKGKARRLKIQAAEPRQNQVVHV